MTNLGLLYNRIYFKGIKYNALHGSYTYHDAGVVNGLKKTKLSEKPRIIAKNTFYLITVYPGLLHGAGYQHDFGQQSNKNKEASHDQLKLGLFFDYTSGLPLITGSAIKGVLKAACESNNGYITKKLNSIIGKELTDFKESEFMKTVFEGDNTPIYNRDIFYDATPILTQKTLLGNDYITHHENPLKDPNPVQFLRVNGGVIYLFQFDLKDSNGVTAEQKSELFKQLILDMGLGAKTNVGYGQFETTMSFEEIQTEIDRKNEEKEQRKLKIEKQRKKAKLTDREYKEFQGTSKTLNHKKGHFIEVIIESLDENFITVKDQEGSIYKKTIKNLENYFERTLARKQKKNPNLKLKPIAKGEELQLRFNEDLKHNSTDLNFTLLPIFEE